VVSATLNVLGPRVLGRGTDVIFRGVLNHDHIDFAELHRILMQAVALYADRRCFNWSRRIRSPASCSGLMFRLRTAAEDKLNVLPLSYVDKQRGRPAEPSHQ